MYLRNLFAFLLISNVLVFHLNAQTGIQIIRSNKTGIKYSVNGIIKNDWIITPSLKPDYLRLYSTTEKIKKVKFITDVDSIEFNIKVNQPVNFAIVLKNKDTAFTTIDFTDKFESRLSSAEKQYALSLFWSEVKYNFAFIDKIDFDIDSLYKTYIPKVEATTNDYDFYKVMELFAASFKDTHTDIYYRGASQYTDYIGILVHYFGDDLYITSERKDLAQTYPLGSKILKINGLPVADYMKKFEEPYVYSDFRPTVKYFSAYQLFAAKPQRDIITITYQTPAGKILTNTPPRDGKTNEEKESVGYEYKGWNKPVEIEWKQDKIAVVHLNTFLEESKPIPEFEKIKDTLYNAMGIIIDLRQNQGGSTRVAWHVLQYLIKDKYFLNFAWQTRINDGVKRATGNYIKENEDYLQNRAYQTYPADTVFIPDSIKRFNVPVVVLISEKTCSAAEDFLIILKERKDSPLFIGHPSFGSTGSPLVLWNFPKNGFARICTRRVLFPYSLKPFTEGITPDILVDYTFDEFMNPDFDKDIDSGIKEIEKQIR